MDQNQAQYYRDKYNNRKSSECKRAGVVSKAAVKTTSAVLTTAVPRRVVGKPPSAPKVLPQMVKKVVENLA